MNCKSQQSSRGERSLLLLVSAALILVSTTSVHAFTSTAPQLLQRQGHILASPFCGVTSPTTASTTTTTALNVWWFGGTESSETNQDGDSCELVAVRIERTSANSRKIAGDITVPVPMSDVWAILTDYDRLSTHVPNLVESRIVDRPQRGEQGDGSFRCKLFQKGAQKIIGFEFGASLTMEMTEQIISSVESQEERMIGFKCVDSFFFSGFDGEWRAREQTNQDGLIETVLNYVVDVRPKGPVPVAALEWRIREDVPTNLRAVKKAAMEVGQEGVMSHRQQTSSRSRAPVSRAPAYNANPAVANRNGRLSQVEETNAIKRSTVRSRNGFTKETLAVAARNGANALSKTNGSRNNVIPQPTPVHSTNANGRQAVNNNKAPRQQQKQLPFPVKVNWDTDETMAAYLRQE